MRSSKPPVLAAWLVENLLPGGKNEALAGDLLEQFSKGRSAIWYWRQVLIAISVRLSKELQILLIAIGVTAVWSSAFLHFFVRLNRTALFKAAFGWGATLPWPVSAAFAIAFFATINAIPVVGTLSVYLSVTKGMTLQRLSRGLLVGSLTFALGIMILAMMPARQHPGFLTRTIAWLPFFFALLLSMWAARPNDAGRMTPRSIA